jgi:hypothetical protein
MTNCTESLPRQTTSFPTQISTILPSRALPLFNCAAFLIGFQCGAYLFSYNAPDYTIVEILRRKSTSLASFALLFPLPHALPARLHHPRTIILQDQDWTVQSRDENLDTIANTLQIHQTLVFTSDRHLSVAQRFCLFTSIVNVGCGPVSGSNPTALPPLRKQRLRHESLSDRSDSFSSKRTSCTSVVRTLVQSAPNPCTSVAESSPNPCTSVAEP